MSQWLIAVGCKPIRLHRYQSCLFLPKKKMELPFDDEGKGKPKTAEPSSSSSLGRTIDKPRFDVFLSFSGEDTWKGFTSHLYNALCQRGISTFIDNDKLERGERIEELFSYIEASKILVPVLSKGYADSRWCLREITEMVECGRLIIPIFFHVDPRDVRNQSGPFKAVFQRHKSSNRVREEDLSKWKDALRVVGEFSNYILQNDTHGNEAHLIQNVVEQISLKLNKNVLPITEHLVGMDSHIDKMYRLLDLKDKEVKMIGIVGMGGIGKTTIATVVHNRLLSDFEDSSFISDVREGFKQYNGGVTLQQKLVKHILKEEHSDIYSVEHGASLIRERFCSKRVLVILDDVDHIEQLEALAGKTNWFGSGSQIIITSRDSRVLLEHGVKEEHIYRPVVLDCENSIKLFNSYAFRGVRLTECEYRELSMKFVKVTGGLPLNLTVFGSLLQGRNKQQWKEILQKLIQVPKDDIVKRLRISYDGLEENVKQIFLDISCFLIGEKKEYATYMWEDCDLYPETAIAELQERSLINVNEDDEFEMHDLLRDMGRDIAEQGERWQWSRLRNWDDLLQSLAYKDKPRMAEGIVMAPGYAKHIVIKRRGDMKGLVNTPAVLSTQDFVDFSCLRLLHLYGFAFEGEFLCLPHKLKWLRLSNCQFSIPVLQLIHKRMFGASNINAISILELIGVGDEDRILMELSSPSRKSFDSLKVLHLKYSMMTRTPDFSKMKMICLRKLTLQNCQMLTEVHGSIGSLKSLVHLDLRYCSKLQRLPDSICTLVSLETLILIDCKSLSFLPEKLGDMKSLRELRADNTGIRALPYSIGDLSNLCTLSLNGNCDLEKLPDSMRIMDSLAELYISPFAAYSLTDRTLNLMNLKSVLSINEGTRTFNLLAVIPNSSCEKVKELTIEDDSIQELPPYLGRLTNIEALSISCKNLRALPEWLGQLQKLKSFDLKSDSLEALPATAGRTFKNLRSLELNCLALKHVTERITLLGRLEKLSLSGCRSITFLPTSMAHHIGTLCRLRTLNLSRTNIRDLPSYMSNLAQLEELHVECCEMLQSLPPLPSSLHVLNARECNKLRTIWDVSNLKSLRELILGRCRLLGDFYGLESIAHNLETLELPGPCGGLSGFSQLSPTFMTWVFMGTAFSSLEEFSVCASGEYGEPTDHHLPFWITFPNVGRGGKRPTLIKCSFVSYSPPWLGEEEEFSLSISIMEEDGHAVYQCQCQCTNIEIFDHSVCQCRCTNREILDHSKHSFSIRGEEIAEYSGEEGYYLRMQVSGPTSFLNQIWRHLTHASVIVRYT